MRAAQNRFKQVSVPSGGSTDTQCRAWGVVMNTAQNRFWQVNNKGTPCRAWESS